MNLYAFVLVALTIVAGQTHQERRAAHFGAAEVLDLEVLLTRTVNDDRIAAACPAFGASGHPQLDLYLTPENAMYTPSYIPEKYRHSIVLKHRFIALGAKMGTSTSPRDACVSGTLGIRVHDKTDSTLSGYITCDHVARSDNQGCFRNQVTQVAPASYDQHCRPDANTVIGDFVRASGIETGSSPYEVDAAFVHTTGPRIVDADNRCRLCATSTTPIDPSSLKNDQHVMKCGEATNLTCGRVTGVGCAIKVEYCERCKFTQFVNQIRVEGAFAEHGDSGAVVYTEGGELVGLLFAGDGVNVSFVNPMKRVLDQLSVVPDPTPCNGEPKCRLRQAPPSQTVDPCFGHDGP